MLTAIVTVFAVPPVNCLMLCLAGVALGVWRRLLGRLLLGLGLCGLVLLSLPVTAKALLVGLERDLPLTPAPDAPPQAIVVLGGDVEGLAGVSPHADLGPLSMERVRTAAGLWRATHLPILVTGGVLVTGSDSVAALMAHTLQEDYGVPVTWVEARAVDTWDNATRSAAILQHEDIGAIYVVTQPWHMRRALQSFGRFKLAVTAVPTQLDRWSGDWPFDYLPRASSWLISYYAFHEWIGCAYYAFRR